jgi:hypothetical protein
MEKAVDDEPLHETSRPTLSHTHPSGHSSATLAGTITNHNQMITAGVANSSDSNTTVSLDGAAACCILYREREREKKKIIRVCCKGVVDINIQTLWNSAMNCGPDPTSKEPTHTIHKT